jgi:hypothetical protein
MSEIFAASFLCAFAGNSFCLTLNAPATAEVSRKQGAETQSILSDAQASLVGSV